jgi:PHP family Zn ribbon phosphoesterase
MREIDQAISKCLRDVKIKDAVKGNLRCSICGNKLRYTIRGDLLCPKCLKEFKV